jgi:hypothetical protein
VLWLSALEKIKAFMPQTATKLQQLILLMGMGTCPIQKLKWGDAYG